MFRKIDADLFVCNMNGRVMAKRAISHGKSALDVSSFKKDVPVFIINDGGG